MSSMRFRSASGGWVKNGRTRAVVEDVEDDGERRRSKDDRDRRRFDSYNFFFEVCL